MREGPESWEMKSHRLTWKRAPWWPTCCAQALSSSGRARIMWGYWCCALSLQPCATLCNPADCRPPGSSVHRVCQARILEWVAVPSSRWSSWPKDGTYFSWLSWRVPKSHHGNYLVHYCKKKKKCVFLFNVLLLIRLIGFWYFFLSQYWSFNIYIKFPYFMFCIIGIKHGIFLQFEKLMLNFYYRQYFITNLLTFTLILSVL